MSIVGTGRIRSLRDESRVELLDDYGSIYEMAGKSRVERMQGGDILYVDDDAVIDSVTGGLVVQIADRARVRSVSRKGRVDKVLRDARVEWAESSCMVGELLDGAAPGSVQHQCSKAGHWLNSRSHFFSSILGALLSARDKAEDRSSLLVSKALNDACDMIMSGWKDESPTAAEDFAAMCRERGKLCGDGDERAGFYRAASIALAALRRIQPS